MFTTRELIQRENEEEEREEQRSPGKVTLTSRLRADSTVTASPEPTADAGHGYLGAPPVQLLATAGVAEDPFAVHTLAGEGVAGPGTELPHREQIQASFGHHDVSGVRAHVGGDTAQAAGAIGAQAYATGDDVAFAATPDLRQAAHEAAHVVQQRGGVRLDGGVGRAGDPYELHADAVADRVVRGESAEALLDTMAHRGAAGGPAVQRLTAEERATAVREASSDLTLEQLAHRIAYMDDATALRPEDREALTNHGFDVDRIQGHQGAGDLQYWTFPANPRAPRHVTPVIAFRGTESAADLSEDATPAGVGMGQFTMNHAQIQRAIQGLGGHGVVATGHSLGGALAQIAAAYYPDLIVRVVTFQAPGISDEVLARLRAHVASGGAAPTATHHRVDGCVVDDAGDGFVPGDVVVHGSYVNAIQAHTSFPLLSDAASPEPWMTTPERTGVVAASGPAVDPALGRVTARGTTAGGGPSRATSTGGVAEGARRHTTVDGAVVGAIAAGPLGAIVGGVAADSLGEDAAHRDAYARIWTHDILPHAEAVDRTLLEDVIPRRCEEEGISSYASRMVGNYRSMFPELAASDAVLRTMTGGGGPTSEEAFVEAVRGQTRLREESVGRVRRYWGLIAAADASRGSHGMSAPRSDAETRRMREADRMGRAALLDRMRRGPDAETPARTEERSSREEPPRGAAAATMSGRSRRSVHPDGGTTQDAELVHDAASRGVAGAGTELPHREEIQASFGHHDVSGVRAHVGGDAAQAAGAIGAQAYATGDDVAFAATPDLRQAAHEAAHVVQQRGGVRLDGGVGRAGDPYEQHADAVAERVVRGESAESLLDTMAHRGASGGPAVQRLVEATDGAAVSTIRRLVASGRPAEVAAIGTAIANALDAMVGPVARVDVEFTHRGEQYRLRVPVADARALCGECAERLQHPDAGAGGDRAAPSSGRGAREAERPAARGGAGRAAGDGLPDVEYEVSHGYEQDFTPPAVPTPFGPIQGEATLRVGGTVGPPEREGRGGHPPPGRVTVEGTDSGGGEQSLSVEGEGVLRRMIDHDLAGFADHFEISHDHEGLHFSAGMISPEAQVGPLTFQFGIDVVHYDPGASGHPPMSLMSPSATCTVELSPRVLAAIGLEARAHASLEIEVRWHPNWAAIWRALSARFGPYFATLGGEAAAGAVTGGELAAAGVTTGAAVPVAVGVGAALAGLVFVGGVMWSMARAAEEGRRQGLATWYIHEYAVQFGDTLFHTFGQHVHGAEHVRGAARLAAEGRSDARDAVRNLTPEQRQQLLAHGRTAVVREVADQLARELDVPFDSSRLH